MVLMQTDIKKLKISSAVLAISGRLPMPRTLLQSIACRACVIEYFSYGDGHGDVVHGHGVLSCPINRDDGDVDDCIDVHSGDADVVVELVIVLSLSWW